MFFLYWPLLIYHFYFQINSVKSLGLLISCFKSRFKNLRVPCHEKHNNDVHTSVDIIVFLITGRLKFLKLCYKATTYKVGAEPLSVRMSLGCC